MRNYKKIAVNMPAELFDRIKARAERDGVSFSRMAADLLDCGLFDYEESEADTYSKLHGIVNELKRLDNARK